MIIQKIHPMLEILQNKRQNFITGIRKKYKKQNFNMLRNNLIHAINKDEDKESVLLSIFLELSDQIFVKKIQIFIKQNDIDEINHIKIMQQIFDKLSMIFVFHQDHRHQILQIMIDASQFQSEKLTLKFLESTSTNQKLFDGSYKIQFLYDFIAIIQNNLIYEKPLTNIQGFIDKLFQLITNYENSNYSNLSLQDRRLLESRVLKFVYILFSTIDSQIWIQLQSYYIGYIYKIIKQSIQSNKNNDDIVIICSVLQFLVKKYNYLDAMALEYFCYKLQHKIKLQLQINKQYFLTQEEWLTIYRLYETLSQKLDDSVIFAFTNLNALILIPLLNPYHTLLNFQSYIIQTLLKKIISRLETEQLHNWLDLNTLMDILSIFIEKIDGYAIFLTINICQIYLDADIDFNLMIVLKIRNILYYLIETKNNKQVSEVCWNLIDYIQQNFHIEQQ